MSEGGETAARGVAHQRLDLNVASRERQLREPARLERFLNIEAEVGDPGHELRVGLGLVPSAHDPESDPGVSLLHEAGDQRVQRAFVGRERVGLASREAE